MPAFTRFVIPAEKVCTLLYWRAGEVKFYRKNDKNDEGFEMQGLIPWQKTIKEGLEKHFGYPPSSVSFRVVIKKDREGHNTFYLCPHKIANKLMWKDLQLFQDLVTYVSIKCDMCVPKNNHQVTATKPKKKSKSARKSSAHTSLSEAVASLPDETIPSAPVVPQISPEEFVSTISDECDRFKENIMSKISAYFNLDFNVIAPSNAGQTMGESGGEDNYFQQPAVIEPVFVKNEPDETYGSSTRNLRPVREKRSSIVAWSWADSPDDEVDVKYDYSNMTM